MNIFENFKKLGVIHTPNDEYELSTAVITEQNETGEEKKDDGNSFSKIFIIISFILSIILVGQLLRLQITKGAQSQTLAEGNRIQTLELEASRGIIYDKNKKPFLKNIPRYQLVMSPLDLPSDKSSRIALYEKIQNVLPIDPETIKNIEEQKLFTKKDPIIIKDNLTRDEAMLMELKLQDLPAIKIQTISIRQYQEIPAMATIVGYLGKITDEELRNHSEYNLADSLGKTGLELAYETELRGQRGSKQIEVNAQGIIERDLSTRDPVAGNNLITTINADLQKKAYEVLEAKIKELKVEHGVVIVENPQTGGILAMVSYPSYNNNLFAQGISQEDYQKLNEDPAKPMLNLAISGIYPSGSIIKPVIAVAGLDQGVITEDTTINDPGEISIGEWKFPDWKNHGLVDVRKAIAESCNVFFYAVGGGWEKIKGLGVEAINKYLDRFGFGKNTQIEISGEAKGLIPSPDWKKEQKNESWYLGDTYHLAIGQGDFLVTPLQMVNATSAIANGGKLFKPHFMFEEQDQDGNVVKKYEPQIINDKLVDNQYSLQVVKEGMKQAVDNGSARQLQELSVSSAGKTGTAQFAGGGEETHAWFTAFAPYDTPEVAVVVLIERGGGGEASAEPVAKEILKYYFSREK